MKYFISFVTRKNGEGEKFANCELETSEVITYATIVNFQAEKRAKYRVDEVRVLFYQKFE